VIRVRIYGTSGPDVVVLHGGPAAAGNAAPIAQGLADCFRVLEPRQRGSGTEPLSVARHVLDLHEAIRAHCGGTKPALVGESWGAMLALAYAAEHPASVGPIVLIGCGTFDAPSRRRLKEILDQRVDDDMRARLERFAEDVTDPLARLAAEYALTQSLYAFDPIALPTNGRETEPLDVRAHAETWEDMLRLQADGAYPTAFARIQSPVLMLHGAYDPHPGQMIRASLVPFLPQLEYREWERSGHSPWLERRVRDEFFAVLRAWLAEHHQGD